MKTLAALSAEIDSINAHTRAMLEAGKLRLPMGNSMAEMDFPLVSPFTFLGEMQLEDMHEQEGAFFDELLRENDLEGEELECLASYDALNRS